MSSRAQILLGVVFLAGALALGGRWVRREKEGRCALDGVRIAPEYRVRIVDDKGVRREFCCIRCAGLWLRGRHVRPTAIYVTDETSRVEVPATEAWYVRSAVVTVATTGSRIHAFRSREDAQRHARTAHGRVLSDGQNPFAGE